MPRPHKGESKSQFMSRCVPIVKDEGAKQDHAVAKCLGIWRSSRKGSKK